MLELAALDGLAKTLWPAATRSMASLVGTRGDDRLRKMAQSRVFRRAEEIVLSGNSLSLLDSLTADQVASLRMFLGGPQFSMLIRQTLIHSLKGDLDEGRGSVREQVRLALRHREVFGPEILWHVTDLVMELLLSAVHDLDRSTRDTLVASPVELAVAADLLAAGTRNSRLLERLDSLHAVNRFAQSLRDSTVASNKRIRMSHTTARFADYASLYVTPRLRADSTHSHLSENIYDLVDDRRRSVLLGDPGVGKSTFAAKLAHDLAADLVPELTDLVPIMLIVRQHTASLRGSHETLISYLEASCRRPHNLVPPPDAIEYLLLNGRAVVIIDGFDELGDANQRGSFARLVEGFAHLYPLAHIIVTSRLTGYHEAPLDPALFPTTELAPFGGDQVAEYVTKWFELDDTVDSEDQQRLTKSFLRESEDVVDLRSNPLLLSLLCALYSSEHFIPRNRPQIYDRCAELLFETWDRSRDIPVQYRFESHIRPAVQNLAWLLFTDPRGRQALPRDELREHLAEYLLRRRFDNEEDARQAAGDFLEFCAGRAWVIADVGSDGLQPHFGFVHRTFLEYFAATQLVKTDPRPQAVWDKLKPQLGSGIWDVVGHLAVQILDRGHEDGGDKLLELIVNDAVDDSDPDESNRLEFAAQALTFTTPSTHTLRLISRRCLELATSMPVAERRRLITNPTLALRLADAPLRALLATTAPDNMDRLERAVADWFTRGEARGPSTGLLRAGLTANLMVGPLATRLAQVLPWDPEAKRWLRVMIEPDPEDVAAQGIEVLFEHTLAFDQHLPSRYATLLPGLVLAHDNDEQRRLVALQLEALYPALLTNTTFVSATRRNQELVAAGLPGGYAGGLKNGLAPLRYRRFDAESLADLSPQARACALLLMIAGSPIHQLSEQAELNNLLAAWQTPLSRAAAQELLAEWNLPAQAHAALLEQISTRPSGKGPYVQ